MIFKTFKIINILLTFYAGFCRRWIVVPRVAYSNERSRVRD